MKLYIGNMVGIRCKIVVREELARMGISPTNIELGEVDMESGLTSVQLDQFREALLKSGLELLEDRKDILVQRIKITIIHLIHYSEASLTINLSGYLSQKLSYDYTYLSNLFSEMQGMTIKEYYILHKIERVKELLLYHGLTLTEIAHKMGYRSLGHLSTQFKKVTGLTVSHFKQMEAKPRSALDKL